MREPDALGAGGGAAGVHVHDGLRGRGGGREGGSGGRELEGGREGGKEI